MTTDDKELTTELINRLRDYIFSDFRHGPQAHRSSGSYPHTEVVGPLQSLTDFAEVSHEAALA